MSQQDFPNKMAGSPPQLVQSNAVATALLEWITQTLCLIGSLLWLVFCASYHLLLWSNSQMNFDPWKVNSDKLLDSDHNDNDIGGHEVKGYCTGNWNSNCETGEQKGNNGDNDIDKPSIFGTITKDKPNRDDSKRRSMPQTPNVVFPEKSTGKNIKCNGHVPTSKEDNTKTPALVYEDGNLNSGTLEAFIQHMVPSIDYYPERTYLFAFLLSSRLYIKPHQLLHDVCQVCIRQQKLTSPDMDRERLKKFCPNLLQLLSEWTETFPYDFRDERMMRHLRDITQKCIAVDASQRKVVGQLMQALIKRLATLEKYEDVLARVNTAAAERMHALRANPASFQTNIIDVCPSPYVLAQQLTHIELERLTNIGPEEFVQSFMKEGTDDAQVRFQDLKRTKNLEAYVEWFNRLSYLVATEVCMHIKRKHRARLIEYFIDVARECFNIGNFNSLMAIMSGLNLSPVARLKKTWGKINTDKFDVLEHQMDPTSNFTTYRQSLKAAMHRALSAQEGACDKIVIPFFSLLVKDFYFLNEGCSNRMPNGYINFQKFWQFAKQVTEFIQWKQVDCPYPRDRQALNYLLTAPVFSENSLYLASYESENPETQFERDQYKTLKMQCSASQK
ncbi:ras-GEF domain-containing family member 1B-like isoform X2 [Amphiura filiformis]|uniref:ras-GEF domain-containing family member 1B-like isoform X2 n=1 Tax=Amphiura filiformis TaxID=82378 RepID=UPI003B21FE88